MVNTCVGVVNEYGVIPKSRLAETRHVSLGRRPMDRACENSETTLLEVRVFATTPLFSTERAHTFAGSRTLAHARDACPSSVSLAAGTGQEATLVAAGLRTLQHRSRLAKAILESVILTVSLDVW